MTIWKFSLNADDRQCLYMPIGAKILDLQLQNGMPAIWAQVCAPAEQERRFFRLFTTGMEFDGNYLEYIGTVQIGNGSYVVHVYEEFFLEGVKP